MKRTNWQNFKNEDHCPIGASQTIPNLTLPVHELMERLTDHTLDDIRAKSLLHGEFFPLDPNVDIWSYVDKMCLAETCIDLTDVSKIRAELSRQIEIMQNSKPTQNVSENNLLSNAPVSESPVQSVKVD